MAHNALTVSFRIKITLSIRSLLHLPPTRELVFRFKTTLVIFYKHADRSKGCSPFDPLM